MEEEGRGKEERARKRKKVKSDKGGCRGLMRGRRWEGVWLVGGGLGKGRRGKGRRRRLVALCVGVSLVSENDTRKKCY